MIMRKCVFIALLAMTLAVGAAGLCPADPLGAPLVIQSRYLDPATGRWGQEIPWQVRGQDGNRYGIFRGGRDDRPAMVLTYDGTGRLTGIQDLLSGTESRDIDPKEPVTLSWGHPVPFDDLDPVSPGPQVLTVRKQVGATGFAYRITKETRLITPEEAVAEGMIAQGREASFQGRALQLITILQDKALVVRQLWVKGDKWWIYEETGMRRSWREP